MDVKEFIQRQMAGARRQSDAAIQGTTDEQFNWDPPGTANPISATLVHILGGGEDIYVQTLLQGKPRIWETEGWAARVGVPAPPAPASGWEEFRKRKLAIEPVLAYQEAVRAATDAYLATLRADDLDRKVRYFDGGERSLADVLVTLMVHTASHAGEIAAVKGMQGVQGLPF
jgi:hypothetical protein